MVDNSGGTAVIDTSDLVSPQSVASAVGERTVESTYTADQVMKIMAAALAGKVSGAGSGVETFVGLDDATDRIVSTVDNDGNSDNENGGCLGDKSGGGTSHASPTVAGLSALVLQYFNDGFTPEGARRRSTPSSPRVR